MTARKAFTKSKIKQMVSAYKKGATLRAIAAEAECSVTTLRELLVANGAEMRPRGKVAKPQAKKAAAKSTKAVPAKGAKAQTKASKSVPKKGSTTKAKGKTKK